MAMAPAESLLEHLCGAGAVPDGAVYECPAVASMSVLENQTGTHFPGHGRDLPCGPSDSSDLLEFANLRVFGNCSFRHQQRAVIEAVLQVVNVLMVKCLCLGLHFDAAGQAADEMANFT